MTKEFMRDWIQVVWLQCPQTSLGKLERTRSMLVPSPLGSHFKPELKKELEIGHNFHLGVAQIRIYTPSAL